MTDSKNPFKIHFRKKEKKLIHESKSPMFKSPSHYWTASQTDFLHSKGSAYVELSIDPFNKALIRIYCQSIDKMVNYKSIEYCAKTTVHQVIEKMIKVLRLNKQITDLILCEAIGRSMALNQNGGTENKLAKKGQPCIFIEQNRRVLMISDYILTVLNYWKPMYGFSRRFELCEADRNNQMSSCDAMSTSGLDPDNISLPGFFNRNGSISSLSQKSLTETEDKYTQTDFPTAPPIAPRRKLSTKIIQSAHLLTLMGEEETNQGLMISLNNKTEFGTPGSSAEVCLKKLSKYEKEIICIFSKEKYSQQLNGDGCYQIFVDNVCRIPDINVTINGAQATGKVAIQPGDIISIGDYYSFYYKDVSDNVVKVTNFVNSPRVPDLELRKVTNGVYSDHSEQAVTSSSISSCSDVNVTGRATMRSLKSRKKVSIDLNGITLACFDNALNQVIIHYFNNRMDLQYAVGFALYLIRFCRESTRCSFTIEDMHDRMTKRFIRTFEDSFTNDSYLMGNLKLTALGFEIWMVYHNENYIETTEENNQWLNFFETFTTESFDHLCNYICETARNLSLCFFDENPFLNIDQQQRNVEEDDIFLMEKFLDFLNEIYDKISKIGCAKTVEIFKSVITSRIVISVTESTVTFLLADMETFTWNKGIQISAQIEKLEEWFKTEGQFPAYIADGFLHDFSKLISTRSTVLKEMDWKSLRLNYKKVPPSILRQFLTALVTDNDRALLKWQPTQNELYESSQDVSSVLSEYMQRAESCTLFQPGITLQMDCVAVDKIIQSVEFISLCTVLDTELIGMAENFQWMALPKPPSLVNFKNSRWMALRESIGEDQSDSMMSSTLIKRNMFSSDKKLQKHKLQTDSDYSSSSYRGEIITPSKKLIAKYQLHKQNANLLSKSLASLHEQEQKPKPPNRKKYKGSIVSLSQINPLNYNDSYSSTNGSKSRGSISGKSCSARIGRSASFGSDLSPVQPAVIVDVDIDNSSNGDVSDVDRTIEEMEKELQMTDPNNKLARLNLNSSLTPSIENGYYDDDDEDQMSVGLSAAEMIKRSRSRSKSSDALLEIDGMKRISVTLNKSTEESYGITIIDGTQTNLKKEGVFVYKVARHSPAYASHKIKPGDQILSINNYSVEQLNFSECLMLMTKSMTSLTLFIEKSDLQSTIRIMSVYQ